MHPYEMQRLMQWRGKDQVVRVQRGSLYPAVERLMKAGLIEPLETEREGRRPERTVYQFTEEGRDTAETWLSTMLRTVRNEFPEFPAALSFLPMLSADDAARQLHGAAARTAARRSRRCKSIAADLQRQVPTAKAFRDRGRVPAGHARGRASLGQRGARRSGRAANCIGTASTIRRLGRRSAPTGWDRSPAFPDAGTDARPAARRSLRDRRMGRRCAANTPPTRRPAISRRRTASAEMTGTGRSAGPRRSHQPHPPCKEMFPCPNHRRAELRPAPAPSSTAPPRTRPARRPNCDRHRRTHSRPPTGPARCWSSRCSASACS